MAIKDKIYIKEIVDSPSLNEHGEEIFDLIKKKLEVNEKVTISFKGIYALNSSFVNSAFIELLEYFPFEKIKMYVHFLDSTKQINGTILKRFNEEIKKERNLIYS